MPLFLFICQALCLRELWNGQFVSGRLDVRPKQNAQQKRSWNFQLLFIIVGVPPAEPGVQKSMSGEQEIKTPFGIPARLSGRAGIPKGGHSMTNDNKSLARTTWNCKYHIVYAPKYRRKVSYKEKRVAVGKILRRLFEWKGVKIVEAEVCQSMCICFWRYGRSCRCRASWGL